VAFNVRQTWVPVGHATHLAHDTTQVPFTETLAHAVVLYSGPRLSGEQFVAGGGVTAACNAWRHFIYIFGQQMLLFHGPQSKANSISRPRVKAGVFVGRPNRSAPYRCSSARAQSRRTLGALRQSPAECTCRWPRPGPPRWRTPWCSCPLQAANRRCGATTNRLGHIACSIQPAGQSGCPSKVLRHHADRCFTTNQDLARTSSLRRSRREPGAARTRQSSGIGANRAGRTLGTARALQSDVGKPFSSPLVKCDRIVFKRSLPKTLASSAPHCRPQ
jgi:hypothetical protein